jgi:CheY-like chemotaxis protein
MNYQILVVEDDALDFALLKRALAKCLVPHTLIYRGDARESITYLESLDSKELPQLILTDLNMPRMNGIEFTKQIKENPRFCHIPVIMQSTSREQRDIQRAYAAGVNSYHIKEIDMLRYAENINTMLNFWAMHNVSLQTF